MISRWSGGSRADSSRTRPKALRSVASFSAAGRRCQPRIDALPSKKGGARTFSGVMAPSALPMGRSVVKLGDILQGKREAVQVAVVEGQRASVAELAGHWHIAALLRGRGRGAAPVRACRRRRHGAGSSLAA